MAQRKIRIGLLGAGTMGRMHAAAYRAIDGVDVAGVWSRSAERAAEAARIADTGVVAGPAALIDDPAIDAIDVCVPSQAHRDLVIGALAAGKHVICETPLALAIEDVEAMIAAARQAQRLLLVGLLMRSVAAYVHLREQVLSGSAGRLRTIALFRLGSYLRPGAADAKPHYVDPSTELMTFDFDFLNWLLGPPVSLAAAATASEQGMPGEISVLLRYADGASAAVTGSGIMPQSFTYTVGFRAVLEGGAFDFTSIFDGSVPSDTLLFYPTAGELGLVRIAKHNPYERELRHCVECIAAGQASSLLAAENALAALRLSLATQQSLRDGNTVRFDRA